MRVARTTVALAAALAATTAADIGCDSTSLDESSFRTARQQRSAVTLANYVHDDLRDDFKDEARALLDAQYEFALARVDGHENAGLARRLLERLRDAGDPRIAVRVAQPTLSDDLSAGAAAYFGKSSTWDYAFEDGASRATAAAFPHEVLMFASSATYDFDAARAGAVVDVEWNVYTTGALFQGPASIASIGEETPPVQGIGVEATLRFTLRGDDPEVLGVRGRGDPGGSVSYTSMYGFADEDDVYSGMVRGSFERLLAAIFAPTEEPDAEPAEPATR